jgi:hypothetical protein
MKSLTIASCLFFLFATSLFAQQSSGPGPEQKRLDLFAGTWTLTGDMKPGAMGPGGTMTENEKCEWMQGNFFLVCHSDYKSSMGDGSGIAVMGYSADNKAYTYREFNSWGEFDDSRGSVDGDTWTWTSDEKMGDKTMKGRFTMKFTSPTTYNFSFEMSDDGSKWTSVMDGKATKK